jgi:hypothetical protein
MPITERVSVQAMMEVFQLLDNNPLLGHYRVKMALDSLGYRYGHTTVWQLVAFYKQAQPAAHPEKRPPNPDGHRGTVERRWDQHWLLPQAPACWSFRHDVLTAVVLDGARSLRAPAKLVRDAAWLGRGAGSAACR